MPVDPRRIAEQDFSNRLIQSEETLPQAGKSGKADKTGKAGKTGQGRRTEDNLTVEHVGSQGVGATQPAQVELPAPTVDPAVMMMLVQSLQSKTSANQETSTGNQLAITHQKMTDSIQKYEDNIKKEEEDKKKAHHKKSVSEWISGAIDAVEFVAGAALVATGVGSVAGVALMATAVVNATDLALTATGAVHGEGAKILGGITIAADVSIAVLTLGAGVATGVMNAAIETGTEVGTTVAEDGTQVAEDVAGDVEDEVPDDESDVDDSSDSSSDSVDSTSDDSDGLSQLEKMFDQELEQEFSESFAEDTVEDSGDSGDNSDDNVPKRTKGQIIKAAVKATFGLYAKGAGIAGAGTGGIATWNKVEQHDLAKKEDDYGQDALSAQKGEQEATMEMNNAIAQMQTQLNEYQKISEGVTDILQAYNSNMTDTGIRGFA